MSTATADPVVAAAAPAVVAPSTAAAAGSPAGATAAAGAGVGAAVAAPASGDKAVAAAAPVASTKALLGDDKTADAKTTDAAAKPAEPVADWKLEAPKDSTVDAAALTAVEAFAKANGLTKAQADKVLERDVASRTAEAKRVSDAQDLLANTLADQVEKHPEFGGAKLPATIASAKRALTAFATPDERKAILASPLGNHPTLIAILARAAAALPAEDVVHANAGAPSADYSANPAHAIYGGRLKR